MSVRIVPFETDQASYPIGRWMDYIYGLDNQISHASIQLKAIGSFRGKQASYIPFIMAENATTWGFPVVHSDGPQVGFLGFVWDVESGYLVFGSEKQNPFIPWFDMNRFLADNGYGCSHKHLLACLEEYKLGVVSLFDFFYRLTDERKDAPPFDGSAVRAYFQGLKQASTPSTQAMTPEQMLAIIGKLYSYVIIFIKAEHIPKPEEWNNTFLDREVYNLMNKALKSEAINYETFYRPVVDAYGGWDMSSDFSRSVNNRVKRFRFWDANFSQWGREEEDAAISMSTGMHKRAGIREILKKSASLVLNLYDMAESADQDGALYESLVDVSGNTPQLMEKAIAATGLDKILKGAKLTWFKRGFAENTYALFNAVMNLYQVTVSEVGIFRQDSVQPVAGLIAKATRRLKQVA